MSAESLWLLCLGLCLGLADQGENEKLPRPWLCAWPSSVVELGSSVTLQCQSGFQNATFMLGKLHDPGFKQEQSSAETKAEFPLASLQPEDAGGYFCAYKTAATGQWSEQSQRLQLVVTGSWPAPSLSVSADPGAAPGHRTLRCLTPNNGSECLITALLRTGTPDPVQVKEGRENQTNFTLRESSEDRGNYSCVYYQCDWPHLGSSRSSRLEMQATDETDGPGAPSTKTGTAGERSHSPGSGGDGQEEVRQQTLCFHGRSQRSRTEVLAGVTVPEMRDSVLLWRVPGRPQKHPCRHLQLPGHRPPPHLCLPGGRVDTARSSHSKCDKQETSDFAHLENSPVPEVTHVELNADLPSEVASVPAEVPPASREGAELEV
ncbi:V-set and transmembrane domain-containing protein 1 [Marmota flaviventris]|uniref:V-set and transmembrane domain-containing protein 1 n=1 Tax=Marmota flaviventris TaxID=93162 RepID=UPI003A8B1847